MSNLAVLTVLQLLMFLLGGSPAAAQKAYRTPPPPLPSLPQASEECLNMSADQKDKIRALMLEAIDDAFKAHVEHTYAIWMKDDSGQPGRAAQGVRNGLIAYLRAFQAAEKWNPRMC